MIELSADSPGRTAALQMNINADGRLIPSKKRWQTSNQLCAPGLLPAARGPRFHPPET